MKLRRIISYLIRYVKYLRKFAYFRKNEARFSVLWKDRYPCLFDDTSNTGFDRHYVYHTAWAARKVSAKKPRVHYDFSSYLYFSAMVSAFVPVKFFDFRPAQLILDDLETLSCDLTKLEFKDGTIPSASCMHVLEHIGLGRYGDPLDTTGDSKAAAELSRVLASKGDLYIVLPVGKPKIQYNAHRIYGFDDVLRLFPDLTLLDWSLIGEDFADGGLIRKAKKEEFEKQNYGCGCFHFTKK